MVEHLQPDDRQQLDVALSVNEWQPPGARPRPRTVPDDAPGWWQGEEEATQSFLHAMGVDPRKFSADA